MSISEILSEISNTGLALFLVVWGVWRFEKFLTKLCSYLETLTNELRVISHLTKDVHEHVKKKSGVPA